MWDTLTDVPGSGDVLNTFAIVSLFAFGVIFLATAVYSSRPWTPPIGEHFSRRFIKQAAMTLGWISGIGLFFMLIRLLQINPASFGLPIWTALTWIALIVILVYLGWKARTDHETRKRNQASHRPEASRRPVRKRQ